MCRGSSVVERRPEKAGVASSILAPGTIPTCSIASNKSIYQRGGSFLAASMNVHFDPIASEKMTRGESVRGRDVALGGAFDEIGG
jgi:hypothetical protein